jgi:hypothetical protein
VPSSTRARVVAPFLFEKIFFKGHRFSPLDATIGPGQEETRYAYEKCRVKSFLSSNPNENIKHIIISQN